MIHLFVYNYDRPFPEPFDYRAVLTGFAITATALTCLAAWSRLRATAAQALLGMGFIFGCWCLNFYMLDLSPHWGQGGLVKRYYELRQGPQEPLVAWQMNWKGENYYSGNRVAVFVDLNNKKIEDWIADNEGKRAFVLMEHKRLSRFERLVGKRKVYPLSTERENNKFLLVKVRL